MDEELLKLIIRTTQIIANRLPNDVPPEKRFEVALEIYKFMCK